MGSKSLTDVPEQGHEAMRAASMRPVTGPAATSVQGAGGGLELPGREKQDGPVPIVGADRARTHEPIPGERDGTTLTHRQVGAMSTSNGEELPAGEAGAMDERTRREHVREGGGRDAERHLEPRGDC